MISLPHPSLAPCALSPLPGPACVGSSAGRGTKTPARSVLMKDPSSPTGRLPSTIAASPSFAAFFVMRRLGCFEIMLKQAESSTMPAIRELTVCWAEQINDIKPDSSSMFGGKSKFSSVFLKPYIYSSTSRGSARSLIPSYTWLNRSRVRVPIFSDKSLLLTVKI